MKLDFKRGSIRLLVVLLAAFLMALNIQIFVNAGGLYPGGAQGLTIIIQRIALKFFSLKIPYTPINVILNIIPIYIGFRYVGKKFTIYSMIMVLCNGFFILDIDFFGGSNSFRWNIKCGCRRRSTLGVGSSPEKNGAKTCKYIIQKDAPQ